MEAPSAFFSSGTQHISFYFLTLYGIYIILLIYNMLEIWLLILFILFV